MKKTAILFSLGILLVLASCGKKGPLEYEGDSDFPRTYPQPNA